MGTTYLAVAVAPLALFGVDTRLQSELDQPAPLATVDDKQDAQYSVQLPSGDAIRSVHTTSKRDEIVLLELYSDRIVFTALISRRKHEEVMESNLPTYFNVGDVQYVRNDLLFWGEAGKEEQVLVDDMVFEGLTLSNGTAQIVADNTVAGSILEALADGKSLKLDKHYWNDSGHKDFPVFEIEPIRQGLSTLHSSAPAQLIVRESEVRCKVNGAKTVIWLDNPAGIFALNGQAIELVQRGRGEMPWDAGERPVFIGRDVLGGPLTHQLITVGLEKCP